jgi:hypothetical protein
LLANEGAEIINGKVVPLEVDESVDLDQLLWGPSDL